MAKKSKHSKDKDRDKEPLPQGRSDPEERSKRVLVFQPEFLEDLTFWVTTNRKNAFTTIAKKLLVLDGLGGYLGQLALNPSVTSVMPGGFISVTTRTG